jgi:CheY-like chemotaxis protein
MSQAKGRILIVEDDPILRNLTQRQLNTLGFETVAVASGEEAVELVRSNGIHLIFMDIGLPGIDGSVATLQIREFELSRNKKRVPVIALTAHSDKARCMGAGMDDFIRKPALLNDVKTVLDKWLPNSDKGH